MKNRWLDIEVPEDQTMAQMFAEAHQALDDLEHGVARRDEEGHVLERTTPSLMSFLGLAAAAVRTGYPTSSMRESSGASVLDDEKRPMPPISDPTGERAIGEKIVDPIRVHAQNTLRGFTGGLGDLRNARSALLTGSGYATTNPGEPGCETHARVLGRWAEVYKDGRCSWCREFWLNHRRDPPPEILKKHDDGDRITKPMIDAALAPSNSKAWVEGDLPPAKGKRSKKSRR